MPENFAQHVGPLTRIGEYEAPAVYVDTSTNNALWFAFPVGAALLDALDDTSISLLFRSLSDKGRSGLGRKFIKVIQARRAGNVTDSAMEESKGTTEGDADNANET